jgi:hypothetical protein
MGSRGKAPGQLLKLTTFRKCAVNLLIKKKIHLKYKRLQTDSEASSRQIHGTVRDIATKRQTDLPCVIVDLPLDFRVDSLNGILLADFRKVPKIRCRKRTQKLQIVMSRKRRVGLHRFVASRWTLSSAAKIVEAELPETNVKKCDGREYSENRCHIFDSLRREEHSYQDW